MPLALALVSCAPAPAPTDEPCRVGELVTRWEEPRRALDLVAVLDTHGDDDGVTRPVLAARLAHVAGVLASGDVDGDSERDFVPPLDLTFTFVTACGTSTTSVALAPGDEPSALARSVEDAVRALPGCPHSEPFAAARGVLAGLGEPATDGLTVALITDEDEPDAASLAPDVAALLHDAPTAIVTLLAGLDRERPRWSDAWDAWRADPGCSDAPLDATPAPALVDAMRALHERGVGVQLGSICARDWLETLIESAPPEHERCLCVPRVEPTPEGGADCTLLEQRGPRTRVTRCAELPGRTLERAASCAW